MRLPTFKKLANTKVHISFGVIDENGELVITKEIDVKARKEETNSFAYTSEGAKVQLKAKLYIFEKLYEFPHAEKATCVIGEDSYDVVTLGTKFNPNGTIHHILLELS